MKTSTYTTLEMILAADETVSLDQRTAILDACGLRTHMSHMPRRRGTLQQAAAILGVHPRTVQRYERDGKLTAIRISPRKIMWDLDEVERLAMGGIDAD